MLCVLPPSRATNFHVAGSRCRFYFLQHKNLLREKVVILATNNLNLQRQHCCSTSCTKMLPVLLGLSSVFYRELLQWWADFRAAFSTKPPVSENIIWSNTNIKIDNKPIYYPHYVKAGILKCHWDQNFGTPYFHIFEHSLWFLVTMPNFKLLRRIEVAFFGRFLSRFCGRHYWPLFRKLVCE